MTVDNNSTKNHTNIFIYFFLFVFANSYSQYVFHTKDLPNAISLHSYASIINVGDKTLDIQDLILNFDSLDPKKLHSANEDLGFTKDNYWGKLQLHNGTDAVLNYYLETARPITDVVELFIVDEATGAVVKQQSGDNIPFSMRSFDNRKSIFTIELQPNAKLKLFLHLKSDGEVLKMPLMFYTSKSFVEMVSSEQFLFGIFYGILTIAAIIYFFFFFALGEKTFLYYSLYVVFIGLLQFALDGFFFKYLTPHGGWFSNHSVLLLAIIAAFLSGKYSEVFLKIKDHSSIFYLMFKISYITLGVLFLCTLFIPAVLSFCYVAVNVLALIFLILIVCSILNLYYQKKRVDSLFTVGIFFLILGFTVFILNNFGLVPNNFLTQNSSKFGTGLEIIFLSLSMSNLIRNLKNEKNELNRLALVRSEEMNDLKSYFLSNISHELRTPLNAIMNLIDSVSSEVEDEKIKKNCQVIKYSSHSLLSSVNDILDFSKIEKDELKLDSIAFNPVKTLERIKETAQLRSKDKGLAFNFTKREGFPSLVKGDEMRFSQIVNNVISNAIKFTSEGFVNFDIESQIQPNNKVSLIVSISDSGVGIKKEKMDSIFDSFSQNSIDNKRKFGGLGLGLYIVKTLVDMQGGTIVMNSYPGKGTSCKITIDFDIVAQPTVELMADEPEVYDLEGKTILVVEDNSINQMVIKMITKKWLNTHVVYANNGQEGLDAFKTTTFDVVLMDLQMPVMDGYEATIAIRNGAVGPEYANIPIIAVTADVMEGTKLRVTALGMNDYLTKPIKKETLYQAIKKVV